MSKGQAWQEDGKPIGFDLPDLVEVFAGSRWANRRHASSPEARLAGGIHIADCLKPGKRHPATYALPLKPPPSRRT